MRKLIIFILLFGVLPVFIGPEVNAESKKEKKEKKEKEEKEKKIAEIFIEKYNDIRLHYNNRPSQVEGNNLEIVLDAIVCNTDLNIKKSESGFIGSPSSDNKINVPLALFMNRANGFVNSKGTEINLTDFKAYLNNELADIYKKNLNEPEAKQKDDDAKQQKKLNDSEKEKNTQSLIINWVLIISALLLIILLVYWFFKNKRKKEIAKSVEDGRDIIKKDINTQTTEIVSDIAVYTKVQYDVLKDGKDGEIEILKQKIETLNKEIYLIKNQNIVSNTVIDRPVVAAVQVAPQTLFFSANDVNGIRIRNCSSTQSNITFFKIETTNGIDGTLNIIPNLKPDIIRFTITSIDGLLSILDYEHSGGNTVELKKAGRVRSIGNNEWELLNNEKISVRFL